MFITVPSAERRRLRIDFMEYLDFSDNKFYRAFKREYLRAAAEHLDTYKLRHKGSEYELLTAWARYALQYAEHLRATAGLPILFQSRDGRMMLRQPNEKEKEDLML